MLCRQMLYQCYMQKLVILGRDYLSIIVVLQLIKGNSVVFYIL